jgi:hypothetical protein
MPVSGFAREVHLETKKVHSMVKKGIAISPYRQALCYSLITKNGKLPKCSRTTDFINTLSEMVERKPSARYIFAVHKAF